MTTKDDDRRFNASASARFTESGAWVITPRLWFSEGLSAAEQAAVDEEARRQLLDRVLDAAIRGRSLGAERVDVVREDGERVPVLDGGDPARETGK